MLLGDLQLGNSPGVLSSLTRETFQLSKGRNERQMGRGKADVRMQGMRQSRMPQPKPSAILCDLNDSTKTSSTDGGRLGSVLRDNSPSYCLPAVKDAGKILTPS